MWSGISTLLLFLQAQGTAIRPETKILEIRSAAGKVPSDPPLYERILAKVKDESPRLYLSVEELKRGKAFSTKFAGVVTTLDRIATADGPTTSEFVVNLSDPSARAEPDMDSSDVILTVEALNRLTFIPDWVENYIIDIGKLLKAEIPARAWRMFDKYEIDLLELQHSPIDVQGSVTGLQIFEQVSDGAESSALNSRLDSWLVDLSGDGTWKVTPEELGSLKGYPANYDDVTFHLQELWLQEGVETVFVFEDDLFEEHSPAAWPLEVVGHRSHEHVEPEIDSEPVEVEEYREWIILDSSEFSGLNIHSSHSVK